MNKKLVTIAFVLFSLTVKSQVDISERLKELAKEGVLTGAIMSDSLIISTGKILKFDTVKVIMLCCDTAERKFNNNVTSEFWLAKFYNSVDSTESDVGPFTNVVPYVYWIYGYRLCSRGYVEDGRYIVNTYYLDASKKKLSKNIYVWMAEDVVPRPMYHLY